MRIAQNLITAGKIANQKLKMKKNEAHSLFFIINKRKNNLTANFPGKNPQKRLICKKF